MKPMKNTHDKNYQEIKTMFRKAIYAAAVAILVVPGVVLGARQQRARIDFSTAGGYTCIQDDTTICSVTDAETNFVLFGGSPDPLSMINTATTDAAAWIKVTTAGAIGWETPGDNTTAEGNQLTFGIDVGSPCAFAPGSAYYVKATFSLSDCSDYEVAAVGFRADGAYAAVVDEDDLDDASSAYTDFAMLQIDGCDYKTFTNDDSGTTTETDITTTSLTDGADVHSSSTSTTLMVKVSSAGAVTYFINGTAAAGAVAFTLDQAATDIYIPTVIFAKEGSTSDSPPVMQLFECGLQ